MPEKIKITKAEIAEIYDITDAGDDIAKLNRIDAEPETEFETFTETYDKAEEKKFREET